MHVSAVGFSASALRLSFVVATVLVIGNPAQSRSDSMAQVHGGTFQMGVDASDIPRFQKVFKMDSARLFQAEVPKHSVTVSDFSIDKYLVTNSQFKRFVDANPEWQPGHIIKELDNGNYLRTWSAPDTLVRKADHPVVNVNWYAAVAYCRWAGKRLPSEAEWEYAARGGRDVLFPWGNEPADKTRANFGESGAEGTSRVGSYPPNPYGLYDMAGNVWEYLADEWELYSAAAQTNPVAGNQWAGHGDAFLKVTTRRVIRGGSYEGAPINLWVEYRDGHPANGSRDFVGFRCAK